LVTPQGVGEDRIDQCEASDTLRIAVRQVHRNLRPETVPDNHRRWPTFGVQDLDKIARPYLAGLSAADYGFTVFTQVRSDNGPRLCEAGLLNEFRPTGVIAGDAVQKQQHSLAIGLRTPQPVSQIDFVGSGQSVSRFHTAQYRRSSSECCGAGAGSDSSVTRSGWTALISCPGT
jgi:hypothetical protein